MVGDKLIFILFDKDVFVNRQIQYKSVIMSFILNQIFLFLYLSAINIVIIGYKFNNFLWY